LLNGDEKQSSTANKRQVPKLHTHVNGLPAKHSFQIEFNGSDT